MKILINNSRLCPKDIFGKTDYEKWEKKEERRELASDIISSIIAFILLILMVMLVGSTSEAKMKFVGNLTCTTYHVSDNTPRGSRATSTGHRATEWHTIAVDKYNPVFKIGQKLYIKGFGWGVVEDVGNFARYGTHLDLFTPENVGFKKKCKVYRKETKKEKRKRKRRQQKGWFTLVYNPTLAPWQIITDKDIISGGTCRIRYNWLDVVKTYKHIGKVIYTGNIGEIQRNTRVKLDEVCEEAVG